MLLNPNVTTMAPPFQLAWRNAIRLNAAVVGNQSLYGVTAAGRITAFHGSSGNRRWETAGTYLPRQLVLQGQRLFAFKEGEGLTYVDDNGSTVSERLVLSFNASREANIAPPAVDDRLVIIAVNAGLYVTHQEEGLQLALVLGSAQPYTVLTVAPREIVVIDGFGVPTRYRLTSDEIQPVWTGSPHGIPAGQAERPYFVAANRLIIGIGPETVAYDLSTGRIAWRLANTPARSFALSGDVLFAAFQGAALWAIRPSDGSVLWQRQFIYDTTVQGPFGLAAVDNHMLFGSTLRTNPDGALLMAIRSDNAEFAWLSRSVAAPWAGGIPLTDGEQIYVYGADYTGAYRPVANSSIGPQHIEVSPRPLRGPATGFGAGQVRVNLPRSARVSVACYRERQGISPLIVNGANWGAGLHEVAWSPAGTNGYTADNQFGFMLVDIQESSGATYTLSLLMPVNTFPDIQYHWARTNIETMVYWTYVNGYPDQTFKPDNLVTRAESSTIIAKTLGLNQPSPSFQTKFTDIGSHWARNSIMALEERDIVGGFAEPDGTFTFRPDLRMTRGQEARILVRAYNIPGAPAGFPSTFTDTAGHWARPDIEALEAAGYITGFREPNGTYTYRPEQNLTRAELCTVVVRIRQSGR